MAESKTGKMRQLFADKQVGTEELENVAGGNTGQTADDSRFLNVLLRGRPFQCDRYCATRVNYDRHETGADVILAWDSVGIRMTPGFDGCYNKYVNKATGQTITRDEAWAHAEQVVGKHLQKSDWYWD